MAHSVGDIDEVLPELAGDILVARLLCCQFQSDGQEVQRIHSHPTGSVRLFDIAACGQRRAAVEDADVVQAEKTALKNVHAVGIFAVYPPGKVQHQLVEDTLQECSITFAL